MNMQITEITIHPTNEGLLTAYVNIVFDNCFMVREITPFQIANIEVPAFRLPFTASNNPELGPVVVVRSYAFSASDCLELCSPYCGWKILLQLIEHLGCQPA